jgi:putative nucleotidyltransferase with HDIG domain
MHIEVSRKEYTKLKDWFTGYVHSFYSDDPEIQQNITLKEDHTYRVCREIETIGRELGLKGDSLRLAEIIALLHDIGRFEQFTRYRTFKDGKSENHADLGVKILEREKILDSLDYTNQHIVLQSIRYHNRPSLPRMETETCQFYSRLIRDADKLDIWKVVTDYYHRTDKQKNGAIELDLPDTPGFSDKVLQDLMHKRIVQFNHMRNLNDFKLLQIGWVFDIYFQPTLKILCERHYLERIREVLPASEKINEVFKVVQEHVSTFRPYT